jgi:hypothetical protein
MFEELDEAQARAGTAPLPLQRPVLAPPGLPGGCSARLLAA